MRLRIVGACAVAVLAATGLTACQNKAGAAAFVGGHRISQSDVNRYVLAGGPDKDSQGRTNAPRSTVLNWLVQQAVYERLLAVNGGTPSEGQLAALHDEALQVLLQAQVGGKQADDALSAQLHGAALRPSFLSLYLRALELKEAAIDRLKATQPSDLAAAWKKVGTSVNINARYGTWSAAQLALGSPASPDYLKLDTSSSAAPAG